MNIQPMDEPVEPNTAIVETPSAGWGAKPLRLRHRMIRWIRIARRDSSRNRARRVMLLLVLFWMVNGFDLVFTLMAVRLGNFSELNPIAEPLVEEPVLLVIFKVSIVAFASAIILSFRKNLLTEVGCWCLCVLYFALSAMWWLYYLTHQ